MEQKIDLILTAQDNNEADMKELKKDIKVLKNDVGLLPGLQNQLKAVGADIKGIQNQATANQERIKTLEARIDELTTANDTLQQQIKQHEPQNLQDLIDGKMRRAEKKKHLIIEGIEENLMTPLEMLIGQILHDTGVQVTPQEVDQVYRIGYKSKAKPRAVLIVFTKQSTRDKVYRARMEIKNNQACTNIWINESLDEEQRQERSEMRALSELAKEEGYESRTVGDTLIVQGIKYTHQNINQLPENLTLARAYTRVTEDSIYFQSQHSWPSSFAPAEIEYMGTKYSTIEQGYTHRMALKAGDAEISNLILKEHRPRKCKALAKRIKNLNWTEKDEKEVMTALVTKKFELPEYRRKLVESEGKRMVECTRDKKWAAGVTLWSKEVKENKRKMPGKNLLGNILDQERKRIIDGEAPTQDVNIDREQDSDQDTPPPLEGDVGQDDMAGAEAKKD